MPVTASHRVTGTAVDRANREKDDFYPTPPRGTQALLSVERFDGPIWEPACGEGHISLEMIAAGYEVVSTDLVDRGYGTPRVDFLMERAALAPNIVTNPPFKMATEFCRHAVALARSKVAVLMRVSCLEGAERGELFDSTPLARVWVFRRRLSMYRRGETTPQTGMLAFAWFVWDHSHDGPPTLGWLP